MRPRFLFMSVLTLVAGLVLTAPAGAQTGLATITGIVSDASRAALPGLTVTATNQATNVAYTGVTNEAGNYIITSVPIGTYVIAAEMPGFKTVQSTVALSANQTARVDFALELGTVEERIEVVAKSAVLQTENAVVGKTLGQKQIEELPLLGRNPNAAPLYTAGVTTPNPSSFNSLKNTTGGRPYVNGQREQGNNFSLDGVDMNDAIDNLVAYQPSPDALEELRVETNNYSPELGNVAGALVNMVLKSGTNSFRGNGFYYWRDNSLAATPWVINRSNGVNPDFNRKMFGGTIGGPIVRGKVFFFGDYQGGRQEAPPAVITDSFATVAPEAWRVGDLSSLLQVARPIVIRDPLTGLPFANNQIPISRFSPTARTLLSDPTLYPLPNVPRSLTDFRQNYRGSPNFKEESNQFDVKVDWSASSADKLFVRYSKQLHESRPEQTVMPLRFNNASDNPFWSVATNWNRIFGAAVVNDLLVGFNDNTFFSQPTDIRGLGSLNNRLGIGGSQPIPGMSEIRLDPDISNIGTTAVSSDTQNQLFQINERLTWIRGRHVLKFGGNWNYYQMQRYYSGNNGVLGYITYSGTFTGHAFSDFLLDQVAEKGRGSLTDPWTHLQHRVAFYAADDLKATDNLTLNLGLRWGYTSPLVEKDDRQANVDLTNAALLVAGQNGNSRALYEPYYKGWEPRLGFAFRLSDKWVYRGGYGITQYMEGTGANLRLPLNPPFFFESQVAYDRTSGAGTIATGFEGLQGATGLSGQPRAWDPNLRPQFTQQWNLFAEYLLGERSSINIGYVGSTSKHLVTPIEGNQPRPGVGAPSTWLPLDQRRPLYQFNPRITNISTTAARGRANYNALQATFKQRYWQGLDFTANYTWSKTLTNNLGYYGSSGVAAEGAYPMNSYDIEANYGRAFFDARHIFNFAGSYELPFGRERKFGADWNRAVDAVAGGWSVAFAAIARTGFPITVTDSSRPSLQGTRSADRPLRIASGEVDNPTLDHWLDRAAFTSAPQGQFGNSGVGIVDAPGYWNIDLTISKRVATFGNQYLMFRGEMFNVLNHPNMGPPVANIQSATFGAISSTVGDARIIQLVGKYYF